MDRFFLSKLVFLFFLVSSSLVYATETISYTTLYTGSDTHSYFKKTKKLLHPSTVGTASIPLPVKKLVFGRAPAGEQGWHNTPKRMFIIVLTGVMQIQASCGQVRNFKAGDVLLAEDISGRGHITRGLNGKPVTYLTLTN